jgi:hypothetical protein
MIAETEQVRIIASHPLAKAAVAEPTAKPDGPLAAGLVAAGIGAFALGLLTTFAEASAGFRERLILNAGVGPLSGKTVWATVIFIVAWAFLFARLRDRDGLLRSATIAFIVLTALGLLGTFPLFFQVFAAE